MFVRFEYNYRTGRMSPSVQVHKASVSTSKRGERHEVVAYRLSKCETPPNHTLAGGGRHLDANAAGARLEVRFAIVVGFSDVSVHSSISPGKTGSAPLFNMVTMPPVTRDVRKIIRRLQEWKALRGQRAHQYEA